MEKVITVDLGARSYDVRIAPNLLDQLGPIVANIPEVSQVPVISESTVAALYGQRVVDSLTAAGLDAWEISFPAGEENKTLVMSSILSRDGIR